MGEAHGPSELGGALANDPDEELDLEVDPWDHVVQVGGVEQACPEGGSVAVAACGLGSAVDGELAGLCGRSTVSFGSSSPQLGSLGWDTDGFPPAPGSTLVL